MTDQTAPESHWLDYIPNFENENDETLLTEVVRLQRAIRVLIAVGAVTEKKAFQAYEAAGF